MSVFEQAHAFVVYWEGGWSDSPIDRGGATYYGVSYEYLRSLSGSYSGKNLLSALGLPLPVTKDTVRKVTPAIAKTLFKKSFWDDPHIYELPDKLAFAAYDFAVNSGASAAVKYLQMALNDLRGNDEPIAVDGALGPITRGRAHALYQMIPHSLLEYYIDSRIERFKRIVKNDATQKGNLGGWLNRADALKKTLAALDL